MARYRRLEVLNKLEELGVIPVFYTPELELAKNIVKTCVEAGAYCVEMTNRGDGAVEIFRELEKFVVKECPQAILGVGSIVDAPTAALYISYGANFVVSPLIDEETALVCNKRKIPYMPGCGTVSEIHQAEALGVEICKIFPGNLIGGPDFVKAVKGPCPWTSIMPTGGVKATRESITEWFEAGVFCVGIGSELITKDIMKNRDFKTLKENIITLLALIKDVKQKMKS